MIGYQILIIQNSVKLNKFLLNKNIPKRVAQHVAQASHWISPNYLPAFAQGGLLWVRMHPFG
jgi:hypothetical protein